MKQRTVEVFEYKTFPSRKEKIGNGIFVQYGVNFEEYENGIGNYSTAIVEMDDGSVINTQVDLIKFKDDD